MIDFYKNDLLDKVLERNYKTWEHTLDTGDFVSIKYNKKIEKYIFKNLKKQFNQIDKDTKKHNKEKIIRKKLKQQINQPKKQNKFILFIRRCFNKK